jgi:uncharacterized membrane protein YfcA
MWNRYKRTFFGMQLMILLVTAAVYLFLGHNPSITLLFFIAMQVGNISGAMWGARLQSRLSTQTERLPLARR